MHKFTILFLERKKITFVCVFCAGLEEEGIYRKPGIVSKATKLYKDAIEKGKLNSINLSNEEELDTKTIASAVKGYLSKQLEEPLLTFKLHVHFIDCASKSCDSHMMHPPHPYPVMQACIHTMCP